MLWILMHMKKYFNLRYPGFLDLTSSLVHERIHQVGHQIQDLWRGHITHVWYVQPTLDLCLSIHRSRIELNSGRLHSNRVGGGQNNPRFITIARIACLTFWTTVCRGEGLSRLVWSGAKMTRQSAWQFRIRALGSYHLCQGSNSGHLGNQADAIAATPLAMVLDCWTTRHHSDCYRWQVWSLSDWRRDPPSHYGHLIHQRPRQYQLMPG